MKQVLNLSVLFQADKSVRALEQTIYGADQTLPIDESMVRQLAARDSYNDENADASVLEKTTSDVASEKSFKKASNVSLYGQEETLPLDISYVRQLARRDMKDAEAPTLPETPGWSDKSLPSSGKMSDTTFYGHDVTASVDMSLIRHMAQKDAEEENQNVEMSVDQTTPGEMTFEESDKTVKIDFGLIRKLAQKDRETAPSSEPEISRYNVTLDASPQRFSFSSPRQLVRELEPRKIIPGQTGSYKFETPQKIRADTTKIEEEQSPEISLDLTADSEVSFAPRTPLRAYVSILDDLGEEDSGEIIFKDTPKVPVPDSPKPVLTTPSSIKKRKRFADSLAAAAQLEAIVEEEHAVPTFVPGGKEERFRTKDTSKRVRSTSATGLSPVVKTPARRRSSSRSASDLAPDSSFTSTVAQKLGDTSDTPADVSVKQIEKSKQMSITTETPRRRTRSSVSETEAEPGQVTTSSKSLIKSQISVESEHTADLSLVQQTQSYKQDLSTSTLAETPRRRTRSSVSETEVEPSKVIAPIKSPKKSQVSVESEPTKSSPKESQDHVKAVTPPKLPEEIQPATDIEPTQTGTPTKSTPEFHSTAEIKVSTSTESPPKMLDPVESEPTKHRSPAEESKEIVLSVIESEPSKNASPDKAEIKLVTSPAEDVDVSMEVDTSESSDAFKSFSPKNDSKKEESDQTATLKLEDSNENHFQSLPTTPEVALAEVTPTEDASCLKTEVAAGTIDASHVEDVPQIETSMKVAEHAVPEKKPVELIVSEVSKPSDHEHTESQSRTRRSKMSSSISHPSPAVTRPRRRTKSSLSESTTSEPVTLEVKAQAKVQPESKLEISTSAIEQDAIVEPVQDQAKVQHEAKVELEQDRVEPTQKESDLRDSTSVVLKEVAPVQDGDAVTLKVEAQGSVQLESKVELATSTVGLEGEMEPVQDQAEVEHESKVELVVTAEVKPIQTQSDISIPASDVEKETKSVQPDEDQMEIVQDQAKVELAIPMEEDDNLEPVQHHIDDLVTESVQGGVVDKMELVRDQAKVELVEETVEAKGLQVSAVESKRGKTMSHASPFFVEGVVARRRTRSTLSESEPEAEVIGLPLGRKAKKSETEPSVSSTPGRRSKKSESVKEIVSSAEPVEIDLPEVEPEIQPAKGTTPARSRKFEAQSSEGMDEGPAPVSIIEDSTPVVSLSRRSRRGETLEELVPSTPEAKQDAATPLTDSAAR